MAKNDPYVVEVDANGCERCSAGKQWSVVGPDGVAMGVSFGDEDAAHDLARYMNEGYWMGAARAVSHTVCHRAELIDRVRGYLLESAMGYTERYELQAERFYRETGYMAPGKSVPIAMAGAFSDEDRGAAWDEWNRLNKEQWQQDMRDVLAALEAPVSADAVDPHVGISNE